MNLLQKAEIQIKRKKGSKALFFAVGIYIFAVLKSRQKIVIKGARLKGSEFARLFIIEGYTYHDLPYNCKYLPRVVVPLFVCD